MSALCALALGIPAPATADRAPTPQEVQQAQTRWNEGKTAFGAGNFENAWLAFKQAYAAYPHPAFLQNLGETELRLSKFTEAARHLSRYLREGVQLTESERALASKSLRKASEQVGVLVIESKVKDADVTVDREPVGRTPIDDTPWYVTPGQHTVVVHRDGYKDSTQAVQVSKGESKTITVSLIPIGAVPLAASATPAATGSASALAAGNPGGPPPAALAKDERAGKLSSAGSDTSPSQAGPTANRVRTVGYVVGGAGVIALAAGVVTRVMALNQKGTIESECPNRVCTQTGYDAVSTAGTLQTTSGVLLAVGAVGLGVGAWMLLTHPSESVQSRAGTAGRNGTAVSNRYVDWIALSPPGSPGGAGALVGGRF